MSVSVELEATERDEGYQSWAAKTAMHINLVNNLPFSNIAALSAYLTSENASFNYSNHEMEDDDEDYIIKLPAVQAFFYCLYTIVFVVGICGNVLVCYVVFRNRNMQTVTNYFITNLALSDILLCMFAVPFTPLYTFIGQWVFGTVLCHLVSYAQGVSVYISAFTLMSIAIDRFFVIIYPFKSRLKVTYCILIIISVWLAAALLTLPYGIFVNVVNQDNILFCEEVWPHEATRKFFSLSTSVLQFVIPFIIISLCYTQVCIRLRDRAKFKPGAKSLRKEEMERERTRRTNRMLIAMVFIFGISWMPLNVYNLLQDFYIPAAKWRYVSVFYFLAHAAAMSSTCYNPFLYAWLNENFRKEFKQVLPCFHEGEGGVTPNCAGPRRSYVATAERTCNGHDTGHESLLPKQGNGLSTKDGTSTTLLAAATPPLPMKEIPTAVRYSSDTDSVRMQIATTQNETV